VSTDSDGDGKPDDAELLATIADELEAERIDEILRARALAAAQLDGEVYGAARLSDLDDPRAASKSLSICFDGKIGWVALEHVLGDALPDPGPTRPGGSLGGELAPR
jgi:hypothetical protein